MANFMYLDDPKPEPKSVSGYSKSVELYPKTRLAKPVAKNKVQLAKRIR